MLDEMMIDNRLDEVMDGVVPGRLDKVAAITATTTTTVFVLDTMMMDDASVLDLLDSATSDTVLSDVPATAPALRARCASNHPRTAARGGDRAPPSCRSGLDAVLNEPAGEPVRMLDSGHSALGLDKMTVARWCGTSSCWTRR